MTRGGTVALAALGSIVAITAAWWALALWPADADTPAWLERTRAVCFGVTRSGLPDAGGWIVLIGEPIGMVGFLLIVWGDAVREALGALRRILPGRIVLASASLLMALGAAAAGARMTMAAESADTFTSNDALAAAPRRVDRPAPALSLVDQVGTRIGLEQFRGRPVLVVFAYGHCETVCPLSVRDAVSAVERAAATDAALLVVTLDPWRDTPSRLATIARAWQLPAAARVLGGTVEEVGRTLDAWGISRTRNESTGEIIHAAAVHLVDRQGRLAFIASGDPGRLAALLATL